MYAQPTHSDMCTYPALQPGVSRFQQLDRSLMPWALSQVFGPVHFPDPGTVIWYGSHASSYLEPLSISRRNGHPHAKVQCFILLLTIDAHVTCTSMCNVFEPTYVGLQYSLPFEMLLIFTMPCVSAINNRSYWFTGH